MPISKEVVDKELLLQKLLGSTAGRVVVEAPVTPPGVLDRGTLLENLDGKHVGCQDSTEVIRGFHLG